MRSIGMTILFNIIIGIIIGIATGIIIVFSVILGIVIGKSCDEIANNITKSHYNEIKNSKVIICDDGNHRYKTIKNFEIVKLNSEPYKIYVLDKDSNEYYNIIYCRRYTGEKIIGN